MILKDLHIPQSILDCTPKTEFVLDKMINDKILSIEHIPNKKEVLDDIKNIKEWEKIKYSFIEKSAKLDGILIRTSISKLVKNGYVQDEPTVEYNYLPSLYEEYPELESISKYFIGYYYEEYREWCETYEDFRLYVIGAMISEELFDSDAVLAGSIFVQLYTDTKNVNNSVIDTLKMIEYNNYIQSKIASIVSMDGVLNRN